MKPGERVSIANDKIRVLVNVPRSHPFLTLQVSEGESSWLTAAVSGAVLTLHAHQGAPFPRVYLPLGEAEIDPRVTVSDDELHFQHEGEDYGVMSRIAHLRDLPVLHVAHDFEARKPVEIRRLFDTFDFIAAPGLELSDNLDYVFVPNLRPGRGMVIGDHVFRSPALILRKGDTLFALVPDLDILAENYRETGSRSFMDMVATGGENHSPRLAYGIGRYRTSGHVYFHGDFSHGCRLEAGERLRLGYYLVLDKGGYREGDVVSFIWERFGRRRLERAEPQMISFDDYAGAALERIFKRDDLYHRFQYEGQHCGGSVAIYLVRRDGVRLMSPREVRLFGKLQNLFFFLQMRAVHLMSKSPWTARLLEKYIYRFGPPVRPQIMFQAWFNNLRSAYGAYWFSTKWGDEELRDASFRVKNLILVAPNENGPFPAICYFGDEGVSWCRGTRGFEHVDYYHVPDCSTTAYHMLQWYRDHEMDPRIVGRCKEYAEFLGRIQLSSGAIPTWVRPVGTGFAPLSDLKESASTACPSMFLGLLYRVTGEDKYLEMAESAAGFLVDEVMPEQKWFDYETFFSCSRKPLDMYNRYTASYPQNTMSMYWAAETFRLLYEATGREEYLDHGRSVIDHLCLYQQVWDPPFLSIDGFGGFGSQNTDAEWNDARQGIIAPVLMDYYGSTGDPQYMERGIAALRACFTTMYLERNRAVAPGNMNGIPQHEIGSIAENYGHFGYDHRTPGYLESDWGPGSASFAAAYAGRRYGDIYLDLDRERAFGVNGCRASLQEVGGSRIVLEIENLLRGRSEMVMRTCVSAESEWELVVNGRPLGVYGSAELRDGIGVPT